MSASMTGIEKAATLLMIISKETAIKIFELLDEDEIKVISQAMSNLGTVQSEIIEQLITEFQSNISENASLVGNIQNTERFLRKVLGKDKVESILEDIRGPAGRNIWDKLGNISEDVLANYLKNEYPQTAALILSKLHPEQSAKVLGLLTPEFTFEVMKRMLILDPVKKEVIDKVEKTLRAEFISSLSKTQKADNRQMMAEIFNNFDRNSEAKFMTMLEEYDTKIAEHIKSLMFTFEDLKKISGAGIQMILKILDKSKLPLALKGASEEIRKLFLENMSQRAAKILMDDIESMGPVKLKDVDQAQAEIISATKLLISKGEIETSSEEGGDQMVY